MRVAIVGRTYLVAANRVKWKYLPDDVEIAFVTPDWIPHALGRYAVERDSESAHYIVRGYWPGRLSGFALEPFSLFRALKHFNPDLIQVDEEPSSVACAEACLYARLLGSKVIFFTWENLVTRYPFPFNMLRRFSLRCADGAIAGNQEAAHLLRASGFRGPLAVIPQLGLDPTTFAPCRNEELRGSLGLSTFTIGYIGRLVPEKGVWTLLNALTVQGGDWQCLIVGDGPLRQHWLEAVERMGLSSRIRWIPPVAHQEVPLYLNAMDVLVLPSLSTERWKEQFGHVLIEAMACEVPVIGSNSGAIPEVIGDAGLIVPEGDAQALAQAISRLRDHPEERIALAQKGRARVLANYTNEKIAQATYTFWRRVMEQ